MLEDIVRFCNDYLNIKNIKDYDRACNGLQFENNGTVSKIGAAVDANLLTIDQAAQQKVDLLIVHHGLFWGQAFPITDILYKKYKLLYENNIAIYSAHLPLDMHNKIGNNVSIMQKLELEHTENIILDQKLGFEIPVCLTKQDITELDTKVMTLFPYARGIKFGATNQHKIAICSGAIGHTIYELPKYEINTLITGEIQQHMFGFAHENKMNIFACGHYATEIFGVQNFSKIISEKFNLPKTFIHQDCEF